MVVFNLLTSKLMTIAKKSFLTSALAVSTTLGSTREVQLSLTGAPRDDKDKQATPTLSQLHCLIAELS
jgi:hypothetical protein